MFYAIAIVVAKCTKNNYVKLIPKIFQFVRLALHSVGEIYLRFFCELNSAMGLKVETFCPHFVKWSKTVRKSVTKEGKSFPG